MSALVDGKMVDVVITYETLFDLLRKEKSRQELQQLPQEFYAHVTLYLKKKLEDVTSAGGPTGSGAQKPLIQYRNVQKILRELYERRERKIIEMAINRARTESNIIDKEPLLSEEKVFFEQCASLLLEKRKSLLEPLLRGEVPEGVLLPSSSEEPSDQESSAEKTVTVRKSEVTKVEKISDGLLSVRFIGNVPKFLGLKGEILGPFKAGDETQLPEQIANVLLTKKLIERV